MRRHPPRAIGLLGLICLLTSVLLPAKEASAHPLDEYVQNTYIDPAPDRTTLALNLTPGVLVAPEMIALIDTDGNGEPSETEGDVYANEVLGDVSLEVDGEPQPLTLTSSQFPTPLDMSAGMGTIRLHVAAEAPEGVPGDHSLSFRNDHQPVNNSKYLVNAFKKSSEVEIAKQDRDKLQHAIRVDYTVTPEASATYDAVAASTEDDEADVGTTGGVSNGSQWLASYLYEPALSPWLLVL